MSRFQKNAHRVFLSFLIFCLVVFVFSFQTTSSGGRALELVEDLSVVNSRDVFIRNSSGEQLGFQAAIYIAYFLRCSPHKVLLSCC